MAEFREDNDFSEEKKLLVDIASMRERGEFHDVNFVCKDGVVVHANRAFLAVRCEFFDRLLYGNLRESFQDEITLPSVSSKPLHIILEYLHTCDVITLKADETAVEAYDLARQYNLPGLQKHIVDFLVSNARDNSSIGAIISTALNLKAYDVAEKILPVISSALEDEKIKLFERFSVSALVYVLKHPCLRAGRPLEIVVFNSVLHWALSKYVNSSADCCLMDSALELECASGSDIGRTRKILSDPDRIESQEWRCVLECVKFECIPTDVLQHSIEKLELVPVDILLKAYRTQASQFARVALKSSLWDPTHRGPGVRIEQDLCDFQSKIHQGARTQTPFVFGVHRFEFRIQKYCDLVWVGVVDDTVNMHDWLGKQEGGWMYGSNGTLCHNTGQDNGPYDIKYAISFREDAVITVCLDMKKREMGFILNGVDYGVAFKNLPSKVYPAVSCRSPGLIKVSFGEKLWALLEAPSRANSGVLTQSPSKLD